VPRPPRYLGDRGRLPPGSKYVPISERRDEVIFDEVEETVRHDRAALIEHVHDDDPGDEDEVEKRDRYGKVVFRHKVYRYHLI
jgi:hypothetical protein